jgi:hypothetical protein
MIVLFRFPTTTGYVEVSVVLYSDDLLFITRQVVVLL